MIETERLAQAVRTFATAWDVPGGVVVVSDGREAIQVVPFGLADRERGIAATERQLFEIGSISKISTALVVLRLVAAGRLDLDTEVREILPWLPPGLGAPGVTVRLLLQHAAGIPASLDILPDDAAQLANASPPPPVPGVRFHYSNVGFLVLGRIARHVTGRPLHELAADEVLAPAGMASSIAGITAAARDRFATGYRPARPDRPWSPGDPVERSPFLEVAGGDGNIAATATDLAAFGRLLLGGAAGVLPGTLFERMITDVGPGGEPVLTIAGVPPCESSRYGLGVNVERVEGRRVLTHGGGMVGYASFLHADLDRGLAVAVVTNAQGDSPVAEAIARAVAADAPEVLARLRPDRWGAPGAIGLPPAADARMVGEFGDLTVTSSTTDEGIALGVLLDGRSAPLRWTWGDRVLSPHPALRRYGLIRDEHGWVAGDREFPNPDPTSPDPSQAALAGRYRCYSPWFPEFRVVVRRGALRLVSPGGVESPGEDLALVPLGDGVYRIGDEPDLPERVVFGPVIDGGCVWVDRDGSRYSRAFIDEP